MAELSTSCSSLKEDDVGEVPEDLVNQSFASEKAAVHFYSSYAAGNGFSMRLDELRKLQNGTIRTLLWQKYRIKLLRRAGIKVSDILNVLRLEKGEALNFNAQDIRNFIRKEAVNYQEATGIHDATELLKILKQKGKKDTSFFYDFTVDEDRRLENILWIPGCAKRIAATFVDVVVFDTTYRLNRSIPYAFWLFRCC
ncbi:hypothetical protein R1sor_008890 [Riccia sorocarpa]|uniref:FAR1-related sequence 11-like HTH-like domain-containing protein n=1 Tax=Riccia sorocarpa TaxID=122646 RepID=A0ABD3H643_9MARC